jgi:hypothetical protein
MITYTWKITPPYVRDEDDLTDVIKAFGWSLVAEEDDYRASKSGTLYLDAADPLSFTEFDSVTRDQVKSWVLSSLNKTEQQLKDDLEKEIIMQSCEVKVPLNW